MSAPAQNDYDNGQDHFPIVRDLEDTPAEKVVATPPLPLPPPPRGRPMSHTVIVQSIGLYRISLFSKSGRTRSRIRIYWCIRPEPDIDQSSDTRAGAGIYMVHGEIINRIRIRSQIFKKAG